jgi:hypothetical protein
LKDRYVERAGENSSISGNELETEITNFMAEGRGQEHKFFFTGWPTHIVNSIMWTL